MQGLLQAHSGAHSVHLAHPGQLWVLPKQGRGQARDRLCGGQSRTGKRPAGPLDACLCQCMSLIPRRAVLVQELDHDSSFPSLDFPHVALDVEDIDLMAAGDDAIVASVVLRASGLERPGRGRTQQVTAVSHDCGAKLWKMRVTDC